MLRHQLGRRSSVKWRSSCEHCLIDNCEAVLVAASIRTPFKKFRRRVQRCESVDLRMSSASDGFCQTKVADLCVGSLQQQVLGLNVQVLQPMFIGHEVQSICGITQVAQKFITRNAALAGAGKFAKSLIQPAVLGFGHDPGASIPVADGRLVLSRAAAAPQ